jgi:hypothetical protein
MPFPLVSNSLDSPVVQLVQHQQGQLKITVPQRIGRNRELRDRRDQGRFHRLARVGRQHLQYRGAARATLQGTSHPLN